MKRTAALRVTGEICFYFSILTVFSVFQRWQLPMAGFALTCLIVGLVAVRLQSAPLRLLLSLLPAACFLFAEMSWMLIFPALAWLYFILFLGFGRFSVAPYDYRVAFRWMLLVGVFILAANAISAMLFDGAPLSYASLSYLALFILLSVVAMRSMQMGASMDLRWHAANVLTVVCTLLVAVGISLLIYLLYSHSRPALLLLTAPLRRFLEWLFSLFRFRAETPAPSYTQPPEVRTNTLPNGIAVIEEPERHLFEQAEKTDPTHIADEAMAAGAFLIVCFLLFVAIWLIVKLARRGKAAAEEARDYEQTEASAPGRRQRRGRQETVHDRTQAVRKIYRDYLDDLQENGLQRAPSDTSEEILAESKRIAGGSAPEEEALRRVYLKARYSAATVTEEDVAAARSSLDAIRKQK